MTRIIYALHESKYKTVQEAAKVKNWAYIGKTDLKSGETIEAALVRVQDEHFQSTDRHGIKLEQRLNVVGRENVQIQYLDKLHFVHILESIDANPSVRETYFMDLFEQMGAIIMNDKR